MCTLKRFKNVVLLTNLFLYGLRFSDLRNTSLSQCHKHILLFSLKHFKVLYFFTFWTWRVCVYVCVCVSVCIVWNSNPFFRIWITICLSTIDWPLLPFNLQIHCFHTSRCQICVGLIPRHPTVFHESLSSFVSIPTILIIVTLL